MPFDAADFFRNESDEPARKPPMSAAAWLLTCVQVVVLAWVVASTAVVVITR